jgi:hypothetical protein
VLIESASAIGRLSKEGDLWSGARSCSIHGASRSFCVNDLREDATEKRRKMKKRIL